MAKKKTKTSKVIKPKKVKKTSLPAVIPKNDILPYKKIENHHISQVVGIDTESIITYSMEETDCNTLIGTAFITIELENGKIYSGDVEIVLDCCTDEMANDSENMADL